MTDSTTLNDYMAETDKTAVYPEAGEGTTEAVLYVALGLVGEAGEVANQVKRIVRDDDGDIKPERVEKIKKEVGDLLWYSARLARELNLDLDDVAETNIERLLQRKAHGTLKGEGDDR